jgi:hypothetical protein
MAISPPLLSPTDGSSGGAGFRMRIVLCSQRDGILLPARAISDPLPAWNLSSVVLSAAQRPDHFAPRLGMAVALSQLSN